MKLRIAIVDDERIARQRLRRLLAREAETEIVAECASAMEALVVVAADSPDLLLLDIQMPGANGFDVVEALGLALRAISAVVDARCVRRQLWQCEVSCSRS